MAPKRRANATLARWPWGATSERLWVGGDSGLHGGACFGFFSPNSGAHLPNAESAEELTRWRRGANFLGHPLFGRQSCTTSSMSPSPASDGRIMKRPGSGGRIW